MNASLAVKPCYHCGEAIPQGVTLQAWVAGKARPVCSEHCLKTAQWIDSTGLSDFYRLRAGASQRQLGEESLAAWQNPALLQQVLRSKGKGLWEVCVLMDGMHCAGCVWLIERVLLKLGGVSQIQINPVTRRAIFTFDSERVSLVTILQALQQAGYRPRPLTADSLSNARSDESRTLLKRLLVAGFAMMQVMTYAFVLYMENLSELPEGTKELFRWLGFLVSIPVVFYSAAPFFHGAKQALKVRMLNMDVPIAIAITAVFSTSVYQALMHQGEVYFESVTMLVFFLLIGRYVEMRARHHAVDNADALVRLTPSFAQRLLADGRLEQIPIIELQVGDQVRVMEGAYVPADGVLLSPRTLLDEALLSGEASARQRLQGDAIVAGSLVLEGPLDMSVTQVGKDTFLATLAHLSTQAQTQRPRLSRRSERITANFVLRVLVVSSITLAAWLWYDSSRALEATIALLVVACPCALGLAAPAAITRALGVLAKRNVLVVKPDALETLTQITTVAFDKTGTLTEPLLRGEQADAQALQLAASLARESQHPLSRALVAANTLPLLAVTQVQSFPGLGLEGVVLGRKLRLGQARFALDANVAASLGDAPLVLGEDGRLLASFNLDEKLRTDAILMVTQLKNDNLGCAILSGDSQPRVQKIAQQLGISRYLGRQLPEQKLHFIQALHQNGERVLVVGDGSNDAPVLAGADVSVALTGGAELAQANADVLLCDGKLSNLLYIRQIAAQTQKILRQNERWAITYNTLAMPAAALSFIPPWLAAIFMSLSSLVVVLNALRIGR